MADLARFEGLLEALRKARECEMAAMLDVKDAQHAVAFAERKLQAVKGKFEETQAQVRKAATDLEDVIMETTKSTLCISVDEWR